MSYIRAEFSETIGETRPTTPVPTEVDRRQYKMALATLMYFRSNYVYSLLMILDYTRAMENYVYLFNIYL